LFDEVRVRPEKANSRHCNSGRSIKLPAPALVHSFTDAHASRQDARLPDGDRVGQQACVTISSMDGKQHPAHEAPAPPKGAMIHRVCIQCNNMFSVPADDYEKKNCPACHKG
jgi:hypothetical protein